MVHSNPEVFLFCLPSSGEPLPLAPFLEWIQSAYRSLKPEERTALWSKIALPAFPGKPLQDWLDGKDFGDPGMILRSKEELGFDQKRLYAGIWRLFHALYSGQRSLFIISGVDRPNPGLPAFLKMGLENEGQRTPLIIGLFSNWGQQSSWDPQEREDFFRVVEDRERIDHRIHKTPKLMEEPVPASNTKAVLKVLQYQLNFYILENHTLPKEWDRLGQKESEYHWLQGLLALNQEKYTQALVNLQSSIRLSKKAGQKSLWKKILVLALCYYQKNDIKSAQKSYQQSEHLYQESSHGPEDQLYFQALRMTIFEREWEEPAKRPDCYTVIEFAAQYTEVPFYSILTSRMSYYRAIMQDFSPEEALMRAEENAQKLQEQESLFLLAKLSHIRGYLCQNLDPVKSLGYFEEGINLRKKVGSRDGLIKAYNGVGYYCFTLGDHGRALDYYGEALALLEKTEDFIEICLTLFNIALTYFLGGDFTGALGLFVAITNVLDYLDIPALPWHSREKLLFSPASAPYTWAVQP
jgi:tetratricopeptide (TPR) repeat protein